MRPLPRFLTAAVLGVACVGPVLPVARAADKSWQGPANGPWSAGPWVPEGSPSSTDVIVAPTSYTEARLDPGLVVGGFNLNGLSSNWTLRPLGSTAPTLFTVAGDLTVTATASQSLNLYNNGSQGLLAVVVEGRLNLIDRGIINLGDRFTDLESVTVRGLTVVRTTSSSAAALRINAARARLDGGLHLEALGTGAINVAIANDETRAGSPSAAFLSGGTDLRTYINANAIGSAAAVSTTTILTLDGNTDTTHAFAGSLRDLQTTGNQGRLGLAKTGRTTQVLSGTLSYTGPTSVSGGTLVLLGPATTATGLVTVSPGGTLAGTSSLGGSLMVAGSVSPGRDGLGTLQAAGTATWEGAPEPTPDRDWRWDLGAAAGNSDRLVLGGAFVRGTPGSWRFDLRGGTAGATYTLVEWTGTTQFTAGDFSTAPRADGLAGSFLVLPGRLDVTLVDSACAAPASLGLGLSGSFCSLAPPTLPLLGNSEPDVTYTLRRDGATVSTLTGNGGELTFTLPTAAGLYTVVGARGNCSTVMSGFVTLVAPVAVEAGPDQVLPAGLSANLQAVTSPATTSVRWSGGTGVFFPGPEHATVTYSPSPAEFEAGSVTLTVTSASGGPCAETSDSLTLTFLDLPPPPAVTPGGRVFRVYMVGNSLTLGLTTANEESRARFEALFKAREDRIIFGSVGGAGVNLDEHWTGIRTFAGDFMKQGYTDDQSEQGSDVGFAGPDPTFGVSFFRSYDFALQGRQRAPDGTILEGQVFDAVVLQPYLSMLEPEHNSLADRQSGVRGDRAAIRDFIAYASGRNPSGHRSAQRFYVYSAWPRLAGIEGAAIDTDGDGVYSFEEFYAQPYAPAIDPATSPISNRLVPSRDYVRQLHEAVAADHAHLGVPVRLIPAGEVLAAVDRLIRRGELPGIAAHLARHAAYYRDARLDGKADLAAAGFTYLYPPGQPSAWTSDFVPAQGIKNLYCDAIHLNDQTHNDVRSGTIGSYLAGATVHAVLTGEHPGLVPLATIARFYEKIDPVTDAALVQTLQDTIWRVITSDPRTGVVDRPAAASFPRFLETHFTLAERADPGLAGPLADPDGDGRPNLLEYWSQSDPKVAVSRPLLAVEPGESGAIVRWAGLAQPPGVLVHLETSTDLARWERVPTASITVAAGPTPDQASWSTRLAPATVPRFVRLSFSGHGFRAAVPIVSWGGTPDLVSSNQNLLLGLNQLSLDLAQPANPVIGAAYQAASPRFHAAAAGLAGNTITAYRLNASAAGDNDHLAVTATRGTGTANHAVFAMVWTQQGDGEQHGFLGGANRGDVELGPLQVRARGNSAPGSVTSFRFLIRRGGQFYVSDHAGFVASSTAFETTALPNPRAIDWFHYDPAASIAEIGAPAHLTDFRGITAVGFLWTTFTDSSTRQLTLESFTASGYLP